MADNSRKCEERCRPGCLHGVEEAEKGGESGLPLEPFMAMGGVKNAVAAALVLWVLTLIYFFNSLQNIQSRKDAYGDMLTEKLDEALRALEKLQKQNDGLKNLVERERKEHSESLKILRDTQRRDLLGKPGASIPLNTLQMEQNRFPGNVSCRKREGFSQSHEDTRRLLERNIWEAFFYSYTHFNATLPGEVGKASKHLHNQLLSLLGLSGRFSAVDEGDKWRTSGIANLTTHIQSAISRLQNPEDCTKAKILVCDLDKQCGFGCQLHHTTYCFMVAFGEQRTLVLERDGVTWRYSKKGWTAAFLPVSSCKYADAVGNNQPAPYSRDSPSRVVSLPIVDSLSSPTPFLPLSFPSSLASELLTFHSNPPVFFIGQFIWYLMRSGPEMAKHLEEAVTKVPFDKGPVVGLQIRRTDKIGTEAAFHSIHEYMEWAEIWFKVEEARLGGPPLTRRIFIATDDPSVFPETRKKYPSYEVYGDEKVAEGAQLSSRYSDSALFGVVTDIQLLSHCSHLVCTFSSQVCRMGYEMMQPRRSVSGEQFHSLDDIYYFGGQKAHEQEAFEAYKAEGPAELDLQVGDTVGVAGNHWNGFSKGNNRQTNRVGLYPSYKVKEKWRIVNFPALPPLDSSF